MRALVGTQFQCGHGRNVAAFENDLSRRWLNQSIEQTDKRRLAGTGETHDNENLARLDAETDVVDCHHVSRLLENFVSSETLPYQLGSALGLRPEDFRQVPDRKNIGPGDGDGLCYRGNIFRADCARLDYAFWRECQVWGHSVIPKGKYKKSKCSTR